MMLNALRPSLKTKFYRIRKVENFRLWHNQVHSQQRLISSMNTLDTKDRIIVIQEIEICDNYPKIEVNGKKFKLVHADSLTRYPLFARLIGRFNP
jgi:hypothetical protein